ncbi:MAG TPA: helix-turn-helix domain-containing protein [Kofleriaceae bacterium]|nr:helix-turn-helix domain-containing protein [Kofleriaceae bacterium]
MAKARKAMTKERKAAYDAGRAAQVPLGRRLRALRDQRGLTQSQVAQQLDISQKYVSELEGGHKSPSWETLVGMAQIVFKISLSALVFGVDEPRDDRVQRLEQLLAGRPADVQDNLLRAVELLLRTSGPT